MQHSSLIETLQSSIKYLLFTCLLAFSLFGCSTATKCDAADKSDDCMRVLFIGNSYTFMNDLPAMFSKLAASGGHRVEVGMSAQGGWTLADHLNSSATLDQLTPSQWDFVVLQEQSQIPAREESRLQGMYPAARSLVNKIRDSAATPVLFMTWAHRDGWPEQGLTEYGTMQSQINKGYLGLARELNVPVAPVGYTWNLTRIKNPQLELWQEDGSHPSEQGTYLAACVFYAVLFRESPEGMSYRAGLSKDTAEAIQAAANDAVLSNPSQWYLP